MYWVCCLGGHVGLLSRCRMDRKRTIVWLCIFGGTEQRSAACDCSDADRFLYYFDISHPGKRSVFSSQIPKGATARGCDLIATLSFAILWPFRIRGLILTPFARPRKPHLLGHTCIAYAVQSYPLTGCIFEKWLTIDDI